MHPRLVAVPLAVLLLLAACSGDGGERLDAGTAERLASVSDALATALEAGDGCRAHTLADRLVAEAREGRAQGLVPEAVATEVVTTTLTATADVVCVPPEPTAGDEPEQLDEDEREELEEERRKLEEERRKLEEERRKADEERRKAEEDGKDGKNGKGRGGEDDDDDD